MAEYQGLNVAYIRVSTFDQKTDRQLEGMKFDEIFEEKISGKIKERPKLQELLKFIRKNDNVYVHSMDRLGRNLKDLIEIVDLINAKGANLYFVKESLVFNNENTAIKNLMLGIMGSFAQFERQNSIERIKEGVRIAKNAGKYHGRKQKYNEDAAKEIIQRIANGEKRTHVCRQMRISRNTSMNYEKKYYNQDIEQLKKEDTL
jgi:DNA invertase Pin-like site-specific DNA recombinase